MKVCGVREDAEDTAQETLLRLARQLKEFPDARALAVWLYKVAKTQCLWKPPKCACTGHAFPCAMPWPATSSARSRRRGKRMADRHCKQIFAVLSEYLDGQLAAKNCRELERHLKGCRPCIAYLESLKTTVEACRRYQVGKIPAPSKQVKAALRAAVQ
jgi:hypothetical protein